jgi:DNA replication protein DnaC
VESAAKLVPTVMKALSTPRHLPPTFNRRFAEWLSFDTFGDPQLVKTVVACQEWCNAFQGGATPRWLTLLGNSGAGKTHCCERLFRWAIKRTRYWACGYIPRPVYWPDFMQKLRTGDWYAYREDMKRWPVLFLDDIGAERDASGYAAEELNTLIGCRVGKWTLITSNKDVHGIRAIDHRIASRMIRDENICCQVNTRDYAAR